jgi:hypothetical protein
MHTGLISFCDRVCNNIKSLDTKDIILDELSRYGIQILSRHWHHLDEKGMQHVRRVPHLACLRSNGNPYYLFITRYEDTPIIFFVDKKVQPGYQKPRMILGRGRWHEDLSDGTLFDGEMVKDKNSQWVFLINDILAYKGKHLTAEVLPDRLNIVRDILQNKYVVDKTLDVCTYEVKRFAYATQQGTQGLIEMSKELPYTNRGIYYWPFSNKYKPKLYNFDDSLIKSVGVKVKDDPDFRANVQTPLPLPPQASSATITTSPMTPQAMKVEENQNERVLWLRKTENPDVYDVYPTDNGMMQGNKMAIAYVKTLEDSRYLRQVFLTATVVVYIPFHCRRVNEKWQPLRKAE